MGSECSPHPSRRSPYPSSADLHSVAFSPAGTTSLATAGGDGTVVLWDLTEHAAPTRLGDPFTGHTGQVWSMAFSPDDTTLAIAGGDGTVVLWDLSDHAAPSRLGDPLILPAQNMYSVAFSPDGTTLATGGGDGTVVLWNLTEPAAPTRLGDPLASPNGAVSLVAFSPAGTARPPPSAGTALSHCGISLPSRGLVLTR